MYKYLLTCILIQITVVEHVAQQINVVPSIDPISEFMSKSELETEKNRNSENDQQHEETRLSTDENNCLDVKENERFVLSIIIDSNTDSIKRQINPFSLNFSELYVPRSDQTSLIIVFDGTASMSSSLVQLRSSAQKIVNEFANKENNPIYNYIFVPFRDPGESYVLSSILLEFDIQC